jgi:hypothetical protein
MHKDSLKASGLASLVLATGGTVAGLLLTGGGAHPGAAPPERTSTSSPSAATVPPATTLPPLSGVTLPPLDSEPTTGPARTPTSQSPPSSPASRPLPRTTPPTSRGTTYRTTTTAVRVPAPVVGTAPPAGGHKAAPRRDAAPPARPPVTLRTLPVTATTSGPLQSLAHPSQAVLGEASDASALALAYVTDAWCGPLRSASGHDLPTLEKDVSVSTGELVAADGTSGLTSALSPAAGGVVPHPLVTLAYDPSLATADAVVPPGAQWQDAKLVTEYCYGAAAPVTPLGLYTGDPVDFEVSYGIVGRGQATWWHVWWQTTLAFAPCPGGRACLSSWDADGAPVDLWAVEQRSVKPQYVVPGPESTWRLSAPPVTTATAPVRHHVVGHGAHAARKAAKGHLRARSGAR